MLIDRQAGLFRAHAQVMVAVQLRRRGITDERVLEAMLRVPRHEFAPASQQANAYEDTPLPIAEGQTISQPYIVAAMLQALALEPTDRVLEVGTGSGYQAALLAEIVAEVHTIERFAALAEQARLTLTSLGYTNIQVVRGDGSCGIPEAAPFDAIVVSAAAPHVPRPLFEQLREEGRMIIPVGGWAGQELLLVRKRNGNSTITRCEGCRFVPLVGLHGFTDHW